MGGVGLGARFRGWAEGGWDYVDFLVCDDGAGRYMDIIWICIWLSDGYHMDIIWMLVGIIWISYGYHMDII